MKKENIGTDFESFLDSENILEECTASALKRVLTMAIEDAMKEAHISKAELSRRMHTSRSQVERILNPTETGTSLEKLFQTAHQLGKRLEIKLA